MGGPAVTAADVRAVATQTREDEVAVGRFRITVTDVGRLPFTVTGVQLDSPGFAAVPSDVRSDDFVPGTTYDLPAAYGAALCQRPVLPAVVVMQLHRDGGPSRSLRVQLLSPDGLLPRLHSDVCAAVELARQVQVSLVGLAPAGPGVLHAELRLRRTGWQGAVVATELRDSVLFAFTVRLPAQLAPASSSTDLPVDIRPATCAAHRIADTKQPYLFPLFLRLGADGPAREVDLPTSPAEQAVLYELVRTVCGVGTA